MRHKPATTAFFVSLVGATLLLSLAPTPARAHCDTLDGPVVVDARDALETGEVMPALKWVSPDQETEIRRAFAATLQVRRLGPEARALADRFFFETLVRVHREGEGAPYTGLKPAGGGVDPAIEASDVALRTGDVEPLVEGITRAVARGLRARYALARATRAHANESVEAGRSYVATYVDLVHYAERLLTAASSAPQTSEADHSH